MEAFFMAINPTFLQRPSDRSLFLLAGLGFPLIVLLGFFQSYIFRAFFEVPPIPNLLVHLHGVSMLLWVVYFSMQVALIRTKNVKLHMTMGMVGIALAIVVFVVGLATTYDSQIVRQTAPPGLEPHKFLLIPLADMILFAVFFGGAIYYRKSAAEHKSLMLMTMFNFLGSPMSRIPLGFEDFMFQAFGIPVVLSILALAWHSWKHHRINKVFATSVLLFTVSMPLRIAIGETETWLRFANWLGS